MSELWKWLLAHDSHNVFIGLVELSVPPEPQSGLQDSLSADSRDMQSPSSSFTFVADVARVGDIGRALVNYSMLGPMMFPGTDFPPGWRRRFFPENHRFDTSLIAGNRQEIEKHFEGFEPNDGRQWWMFELSRTQSDGVKVLLYEDLALGEGTNLWLTMTQRVPSSIQSFLERVSTLEFLLDAPESELRAELGKVSAGLNASVAVFDVGQGNCNAILDNSGVPALYFDYGRPLSMNAHTAPAATPKFYIGPDVPIVLSHWDFDHWGAAKRPKPMRWLKAAVSATWIAPRQYLRVGRESCEILEKTA